jgi:hypothetical protein
MPCKSCSVCGIAENGFQVERAQTNISWGRFGKGIYLCENSSKAHDYNAESESSDGSRVIILSYVALGKQYVLSKSAPELTAPPYGYNSIYGQTGVDLNYQESVVYDNHAVLPYAIVKYNAVVINSAGYIAKMGTTGKYYCGRRVLYCSCCDGHCGPTNGCNCESCQQLDRSWRY